MRSWHDFHLVGYAVDGKRAELSFQLEWPYETETDVRRARVTFSGLECYYFEHDLGENIMYGLNEVPLQEHLEQWTGRFETECKWGWPKFWRPVPYPKRPVEVELSDAVERLLAKGVKCFELTSSYGLSGWVMAVDAQHAIEV
jgi:hypothetical protein